MRYRLLFTGLLCAALTGLTGGAGILSLRLIHGKIQDSTGHIRNNMAEQNTKMNQVISLRSLVQSIDSAEDFQDLSTIDRSLAQLRNQWTLATQGQTQDVMIRVGELQRLKADQVRACYDLEVLKEAHYAGLDEIRSQVLLISDNAEFDSTLAIDEAFSSIRNDFDEMLLSTDNAFSSTKAATMLHTFCYEIDAKVKEAYLSSDKAFISYLKDEIKTLLTNTNLVLEKIPENEDLALIRRKLGSLASTLDSMFEERIRSLGEPGPESPAASSLETYRTKISDSIGVIRDLASQTLDDTEFDGAMNLETAMSGIRTDLENMTRLMGEELQTIKTALAVRYICTLLDARTKEALVLDDTEMLDYLKTEIQTLLINTQEQLERLPVSETSILIGRQVNSLETLTAKLFETKSRTIECNRQFIEEQIRINKQMEGIKNTMSNLARDVKAEAEETMFECSAAVSRWQSLEIILVCGSFLLAVIIGAMVSASVTRQLQKLNNGIKIAGEGDLNHKVDTGISDEIGDLSRTFDGMTRKLSAREYALRESEQRFRKLFELSNDGIIIHTCDQEIIQVNKRMAEMIGYDIDYFMGKNVLDLHVSEERDRAATLFNDSDPSRMRRFESRYTKSNGEVITVDIRSSLIDENEGVIQSIVRDITQEKRSEEEFKQQMNEVSEANRHLEVLVANTTDREKKMVALKREINDLLERMGQAPPYEAPEKVDELLSQGGSMAAFQADSLDRAGKRSA
ncbi:MAG: PAS domain S-box protein [Planctomycetota bacterium]